MEAVLPGLVQLMDGIIDGKDKDDDDEADLDDPGKPLLDFIGEDHKSGYRELEEREFETRLTQGSLVEFPRSFESSPVSVLQPASFPIKLNSGRYMEMTTPPTTTPSMRMIIGSMAVSKSPTAASTSSS